MNKAKFGKPNSFYRTFDRKETVQHSSHYCPGCGHGIVHKLIAEAIDDLGIQDRTIMLSPVGCSVFLYYYFDTGNVQCSHGRAPAVATGLRRSLDDAIIVSYQGDGDLAGIGTTEIVHAANRGENITVLFINNAIYGMTGGQMAPTTLIGQKTMTTPDGRSMANDGAPIGMAEVMNAIQSPVYIERTSLSSPANILRTRKAVFKALRNQVEHKGFSFVEILSPCPVNWKMEPSEALEWISATLEPAYPVKIFRDTVETTVPQPLHAKTHPFLDDHDLLAMFRPKHAPAVQSDIVETQTVKIGGFGGQGVMLAGTLLAECAVAHGLNATWLPSYGPEMRGGTSNASVTISGNTIGSPVVNEPDVLIALNAPSLTMFESSVRSGGLILVNSSITDEKVKRDDVQVLYVPASAMAKEAGIVACANILMLAVYALATSRIDLATLRAVIPNSIRKPHLAEANLAMVDRAIRFFEGKIR